MWDYSLSVDVLGLVVEAITGQSLGAFLQERLWGPLGMADTSFAIPDNKKGRYALAFPNDPLTSKAQSVLHAGKPIKFDCGGACAAGTAIDYLRFAQMLLNGGVLDGKRIVSRAMLEMMTSDQLGPDIRARTTSTDPRRGLHVRSRLCHPPGNGHRADRRQQGRLHLGRRLRHLLLGRPEGAVRRRIHVGGARRDPRPLPLPHPQPRAAGDRGLGPPSCRLDVRRKPTLQRPRPYSGHMLNEHD